MTQPLNLRELEALAAARIAQPAWDYYRSGACDEITLRRNEQAFAEIALRYRVLVDVSRRSTRARVLGRELALPVLIAPTAFHKLAHPDGEIATARAAAQAGTIMVLSTLSNTKVEDVVAATSAESGSSCTCIATAARPSAVRARAGRRLQGAGADGRRTAARPARARRAQPLQPARRSAHRERVRRRRARAASRHRRVGLFNYFTEQLDASLTWKDIEWLRSLTELPLLDQGHRARRRCAARARPWRRGGDRVRITGGASSTPRSRASRRCPRSPTPLAGSLPILLDGGVRRGTDVLKALALGAQAVLLGRPILWGLAAGGQQGVHDVLELLRREIDLAQALCGYADLAEVGRDLLAR